MVEVLMRLLILRVLSTRMLMLGVLFGVGDLLRLVRRVVLRVSLILVFRLVRGLWLWLCCRGLGLLWRSCVLLCGRWSRRGFRRCLG